MLAERGELPELPAPGWVDRKRLYALPLDLRRLSGFSGDAGSAGTMEEGWSLS
jgi:hypothetical protein